MTEIGRRRGSGSRGTLVLAWLVLVVSAAAVLSYKSRSEESIAPVAAKVTSRLYVDPDSQAADWVKKHPDSPEAEQIDDRIARQPAGKWFGAWSGDITSAVDTYTRTAAEQHKIPVLVPYNLPDRDCGGQSAGGAADRGDYNRWIDGFAAGLHDRRALVVLEPDSLAMLDGCLTREGRRERLHMLSRAVNRLETKNVWVYLDAGHSNWVPAKEMAHRLRKAGIAKAHGFSLNVSNYNPTKAEAAYGLRIDKALGTSKPFVIDTSRNGNGNRTGAWCNPPGTKVGALPQAGIGGAELLIWVNAPGGSDGDCGTGKGIPAGQFSPKLANRMLAGA